MSARVARVDVAAQPRRPARGDPVYDRSLLPAPRWTATLALRAQVALEDLRDLVPRSLGHLTIKDCFHTLSAVACGVEGSESVETISWAEPLRGGWGYGD